ncbi:MAG TPA: DUF1223 domain-containing protein [Puia sp.]|nr:DUF1223 domain-containing protein [Puia sp.]
MRKSPNLVIFICLSILALGFFELRAHNASGGFAVVELFTSEGCSSCPPADEAVAELAQDYRENVYVLGFHVDYWNSLGWKDEFSNPTYSNRQKQYASILNLEGIYTPQIIVNGRTEFVGSDKATLISSVRHALQSEVRNDFKVFAKCKDGKIVVVSIPTQGSKDQLIVIALVQLHATSQVGKGENKGKTLQHINIVRDMTSLEAMDQTQVANLKLPPGAKIGEFRIIAFRQEKVGWAILNATESPITNL